MTEIQRFPSRADEASDDIIQNPSANPTIGDVIAARFDRRDLLKGALGVVAITATMGPLALAASQKAAAAASGSFNFKELVAGVDEKHHVAEGYEVQVLMRWGDPVVKGAPAFDPMRQTAAAQKMQFGYNNDFIGYLPVPGAANPGQHGLLVVNHEYTNEELMFPGVGKQDTKEAGFAKMTPELVAIEKAAHGGSIIEVRREGGQWLVVPDSKYARRIDAETAIEISGPAAGNKRLQTTTDPTGKRVLGMIANCAGGKTPWGTWLTCEENFHFYFWGKLETDHPEAKNYKRYGVPENSYAWGKFEPRFDVTKEPNEANRFGWVVEIDPFAPASIPKKRTALGRFKHEGAAGIVNKDGRYVVYSGDDERFDYVYRFITKARVDLANPVANRDILDEGTLSVAKYDADGSVEWLPLVHGTGPLTQVNGFAGQADVLIETRRAADLLGATKMDRPEDIEANPVTQKVYVVLTFNENRKPEERDAANPRADNKFGHLIEMTPPDGDHAADRFSWEILVKCGDPAVAAVGASFSSETTKDGWFGMPDNIAFDSVGRLWVATDGNTKKKTGRADGLWAMETEGPSRGTSKHFFRVPIGAEMCGPEFTPDGETLFLAVQHPGEKEEDPSAAPTTFEDPPTRWPDFQPNMPPRPSVVAITKRGGGKIAT